MLHFYHDQYYYNLPVHHVIWALNRLDFHVFRFSFIITSNLDWVLLVISYSFYSISSSVSISCLSFNLNWLCNIIVSQLSSVRFFILSVFSKWELRTFYSFNKYSYVSLTKTEWKVTEKYNASFDIETLFICIGATKLRVFNGFSVWINGPYKE